MKKSVVARQAELELQKKAVVENPNSSRAHFRLGTALIKVGFLGEGQAALERALELDPDRVDAWVNLGGARLGRWDFVGCVEANQQALNREPELMRAHFNQGLAYMYLGEAEKMLACFEKVLEIDPDSAAGHYHMAVALQALGKEARARMFLVKATGLGHSPDPSFVKALEQEAEKGPSPVQILEVGPEPDEKDNEEVGK
jgi:tetratricopeptide (TPR) repeat protein